MSFSPDVTNAHLSRRHFVLGSLGLAASLPLWGCGGGTVRTPSLGTSRAAYSPLVAANADIASSISLLPVSDSERQLLQATHASATEADRAVLVAQMPQSATVRWNERARALVAKYKSGPPPSARTYALLSAAQHDAVLAARNTRARLASALSQRPITGPGGIAGAYFADDTSAVIVASAEMLAYQFPQETDALRAQAESELRLRLLTGWIWPSDRDAAETIGRAVARNVIAYAKADGADQASAITVPVPVGPGKWTGTNPLLPAWTQVKPWCVDVAALRADPPPAFDSAQFQTELAEIRQISDTRTAEQLAIAQFWADGAGTVTPPGHWNQIAADLIATRQQAQPDEREATRTLAVLNAALQDAAICCWDTKYTYWTIRPSQADPKITLPIGLPNFPSFTSGHSTFSGAAAEVLSARFPDAADKLDAMAQEASISRMYGGIHYRTDCQVGLDGGRKVGQIVLARLG